MQPYTTEQSPMPMALRPNKEKKMAKQKGARANKPNDSFGTLNNASLYRGKYREDVWKEEEEDTTNEQKTEETNPDPSEEATQDKDLSESFAEKKETKEVDYKKRYDDLKKHYDQKQSEWKQQLESSQSKPQTQPKGKVDDFREKYPEVHDAVAEIAANRAESQIASLQEEIDSLKQKEKNLYKEKAYEELLRLQPNFNKLKSDEEFLEWLEKQPESISDGIYKNNTDAQWASRVVDLYHSDIGKKKSTKSKKSEDAATNVTSATSRDVATDKGQKRIWKASEIQRLKPWDFEKLEKEIDQARSEGRIDFQN
jgi:hypothetical protein